MNKTQLICLSVLSITVLFFLICKFIHLLKKERFSNLANLNFLETERQKKHRHPFRFFKDEKGNSLPIVAITAFFRSNEDKEKYYNFKKNNIQVIGVTAYRTFPNIMTNPEEDYYQKTDDFQYTNEIKVWLYCMKNCLNYNLNSKQHKLLDMSESDFYTAESSIYKDKKYDFLYVCLKDDDKCSLEGWQSSCRNFQLALKCFPILCNQFKLKGLLVGRIGCGLEQQYPDLIETTDFLNYHDLQQKMKESKFLFVPNISDASPRVVSECLIKNVPILMNSNIVCGFKYINYETGEFFSDENNLSNAIQTLLDKLPVISPQKWWSENYSYQKSSKKLRNFLYESYPSILENTKEVSFYL